MAGARLQAAVAFLVALVAAPVNASNGVQYIQPDWAQVCVILVQPRERARLSAHCMTSLPSLRCERYPRNVHPHRPHESTSFTLL